MENQEKENELSNDKMWKQCEEQHRRGRRFGGLVVVAIGVIFLLGEMGAEIPNWLWSWKTLLIVIGLYIAVKHKLQKWSWLIPFTIGSVALFLDVFPEIRPDFSLWPFAIILVGLYLLFKPRRKYKEEYWKKHIFRHRHHWKYRNYGQEKAEWGGNNSNNGTSDDYIEAVTVFGALKKNIISKDFKGGELTAFFGGAEVNLSQADIQRKVTLELNQVFGGVRLIVPPHWEIQSELVTIFGNTEDKRQVKQDMLGENKILVLRGNVIFGGIEIKSF